MASPTPSPPPPPPPHHNYKSTKLDYYYFVIGLSLVAIVLLLANAIAVGCCSWLRQSILSRGTLGREFSDDEMRRWMPTYSYVKRKDDEAAAEVAECVVCISAFEDGEEVRRMAQCGHSFHAGCIDMWLNSHNSCPVCRENVLPTPLLQSIEMSASSFNSQDYLVSSSSSMAGTGRAAVPVALP